MTLLKRCATDVCYVLSYRISSSALLVAFKVKKNF